MLNNLLQKIQKFKKLKIWKFKKTIQKTSEAKGNLIENHIADKITELSEPPRQYNS